MTIACWNGQSLSSLDRIIEHRFKVLFCDLLSNIGMWLPCLPRGKGFSAIKSWGGRNTIYPLCCHPKKGHRNSSRLNHHLLVYGSMSLLCPTMWLGLTCPWSWGLMLNSIQSIRLCVIHLLILQLRPCLFSGMYFLANFYRMRIVVHWIWVWAWASAEHFI